ncbi:MAG: Glycosyl transferase family 2 [Candidatus Collierbacteria bacterium GW2011_GWA1_44_12]|uniref:Glycosyl transferase family 2 n=1 Tax=Candidatus Collierbacteria bacterium GW2011_GWA1_44_12 TaxID=1618376 RepID=A0A0G1IRF7_9BACT|nr:MAG: Glycosyl transferase family 2 [Candidatus Collierbacteria bacterium GW2011_GWA1_44_12]
MKRPTNELAIIIVSYNTRQLLDNCLASVFKAAKPTGGLQVVVVDNASKDGSVKMIEKQYPQVLLIKKRKNLGFAKANNLHCCPPVQPRQASEVSKKPSGCRRHHHQALLTGRLH